MCVSMVLVNITVTLAIRYVVHRILLTDHSVLGCQMYQDLEQDRHGEGLTQRYLT